MSIKEINEEIAEAKRELRMRQSVYPRLVSAGKLPIEDAERRCALQERIIERLEAVKALQQLSLFEERA